MVLKTAIQNLTTLRGFILLDLKKFNASNGLGMYNWKELFNKNIADRQVIDFVLSNKRTTAILRYYDESELRNVLEPLTYEKRVKFLDDFGSVSQLDNIAFNKLIQDPKRIDFIVEFQNSTKAGPDVFVRNNNIDDIIDIVKSDLNSNQIQLLTIKNKTIANDALYAFKREMIQEIISINELNQVQNGNAYTNLSNLNPTNGLKEFQVANKLITKTEIYNDNVLVSINNEKFISGRENVVKNDIFNGSIPNDIKEPNYFKFNLFKKKAYDLTKKRKRENDTELKYIFNLLEEHWSLGNRFDIEIKSTYYVCESCQGYLVYLKELAKQNGKIINLKVIADPRIEGSSDLIEVLNLN